MHQRFQSYMEQLPELYEQLISKQLLPVKAAGLDEIPAIYVFYEEGRAVHVGRTRNLKGRIQGHRNKNHYSASFAFKRARKRGGYEKASYKPEGSRSDLANGVLKEIFLDEIEKVKGMQLRYLKVKDPILQYLLELYSAMELGTELDEFNTH
jgi:hypothetical protein